jgi:hypothetical protein
VSKAHLNEQITVTTDNMSLAILTKIEDQVQCNHGAGGTEYFGGKCFWLLGSSDLSFKIIIKKHISKFQKIMKTNLDIVNDVTYKHENFKYKILYIMGYTKMTNSDQICRFESIYTTIYTFVILCSPEYKVFEHEFLHVCWINSWLHPNILFKKI